MKQQLVQDKRSLCNVIKIEYPLKQGLKLLFTIGKALSANIKIEYPLKQGLKQACSSIYLEFQTLLK